jgi:hypothetical protein
MDRLNKKNDIYVKLGVLFGPLLHMTTNPALYDEQEKAETLARYFADYPALNETFRAFCVGQPGHNYAIEFEKFFNALNGLKYKIMQGMELSAAINEVLSIARACVDAVPVPKTSVILEAGSPFKAYCKLRELCEADAAHSIQWLDPFMGASIFHRFIGNLRPGVSVTLVTAEPGTHAGNRDKSRWIAFLDISRLFAQEKGGQLYRLIVQPNLHDRWVVFDNKRIYSLGGSAKDAGDKDYFTITAIEPSQENMQKIADHINTGTEFYGPNVSTHL